MGTDHDYCLSIEGTLLNLCPIHVYFQLTVQQSNTGNYNLDEEFSKTQTLRKILIIINIRYLYWYVYVFAKQLFIFHTEFIELIFP